MWWERNEKRPFVHHYPGIIRFLGYEPWEQPATLGEALLSERRRQGLRIDQAASLTNVNEGTWRRWERGEWKPTSLSVPRIDQFLGLSCKELFPLDVRG